MAEMSTPANVNRPTRSALSRSVTCIEAQEEGYSFVNTCSKCDYYLSNRFLNNKAMSRPCSELSKMWQCTRPHKLGDLYLSAMHNTPYDETPINKNNSFLVSSFYASTQSSGISSSEQVSESVTRSQGSSKRARVDVEKDLERAVRDCDKLRQEFDEALSDCNRLRNERDEALKDCNKLRLERDEAIKKCNMEMQEHDDTLNECNMLRHERDKAVSANNKQRQDLEHAVNECNLLRNERDEAKRELEKFIHEVAAKQAELVILREELQLSIDGRAADTKKSNAVSLDSSRMKVLLENCTEKVRTLTARVLHLEAITMNKSTIHVSSTVKSKAKSIRNFAKKLYPTLNNKEQLTSMYDELYSTFKSFRKHVKSKLKGLLLDELRMETCREIKKYFAPWRFLEVMDCSQQSLNQVSFVCLSFFFLFTCC
jgi:hypothetical protein